MNIPARILVFGTGGTIAGAGAAATRAAYRPGRRRKRPDIASPRPMPRRLRIALPTTPGPVAIPATVTLS
jgi:hypothetical protein